MSGPHLSLSDLSFEYPPELVATAPIRPPRVMWVENQQPTEISWSEFLLKFGATDVLVLNDTRVLKRRIFAPDFEILFLSSNPERTEWEVLFPSRNLKVGDLIHLPGGEQARLVKKGKPQKIQTLKPLLESYFLEHAELPLPPYIQKARGHRQTVAADQNWYQTAWAEKPGSLAAPTASLHFSDQDLEQLRNQGVQILHLTLHVGLGTFLPLTVEAIAAKKLHEEVIEIPLNTWQQVESAKRLGQKVWALGTTVTRSLEACARGHLQKTDAGFLGVTDLFIQPGDSFLVVQGLLTNFHQPESSLLSLVHAFASPKTVKACYEWAIQKRFRLFSYGDLSAWK